MAGSKAGPVNPCALLPLRSDFTWMSGTLCLLYLYAMGRVWHAAICTSVHLPFYGGLGQSGSADRGTFS